MLTLRDLATFLNATFQTDRYPPNERGGYYVEPDDEHRPVKRIGLALDPWPELPTWVEENALDALWLHRPWKLDAVTLPPDVAVLFHHLPFDETLGLGYNVALAQEMDLQSLEELGHKQAEGYPPRAIGMLGNVAAPRSFASWQAWANATFWGYEQAVPGRFDTIGYVAVVGAMTDALVREAAERGAQLYITGQLRKPALEAVNETGLAVLAPGHDRSERWGLRALAELLRSTGVESIVW